MNNVSRATLHFVAKYSTLLLCKPSCGPVCIVLPTSPVGLDPLLTGRDLYSPKFTEAARVSAGCLNTSNT